MSLARLPIYLSQLVAAPAAGSGSGVLAYTSSATGRRAPYATASGTVLFAGTATGKRTAKASSSGAFAFTGTGAGKTDRLGSGAGVFAYEASSSGHRSPKATGVGAFSLAGAAVGTMPAVPPREGSGTGAYAFVGDAAGEMAPLATGTGSQIRTGSAFGLAPSLVSTPPPAPPLVEGPPTMATATITFDASDYGGMDFDPRRAKVYATNNTEDGAIYDVLGDRQYFGSATGTFNTDGTGEITVPVPGDGFIPETWQSTIHFDLPDRNHARGRRTVSIGPVTITEDKTVGELVEEADLLPVYAAPALNRIDGVTDHGNVSGAVELDSDISTHWLDATGATVLTLTDGPTGGTRYVSVLIVSGADDVTVDGLDVTFTDGGFATFAWVRGAWILAGAGSSTPSEPGETTPPTAGTLAGSAISDTGFTLTVTGAADETALASAPYSFSTNNGSTWSAYQSSAVKVVTGLTDDTAYQCRHRVKDAAGNVTVGTMVTVTTEETVVTPQALKVSREPLYYWPLDDNAGTTTPVNLGTGVGTASVGSGVTMGATGIRDGDKSASFSGTGDSWIQMPLDANLIGATSFTLEFMVLRTNSASQWMGSGTGAGSGDGYHFAGGYWTVSNADDFAAGLDDINAPGHLIGLTYDGTTIKCFKNGVKIGTDKPKTGAITGTNSAGKIGSRGDGSSMMTGRIAEVVIYKNVCLTEADMLATAQAHGLA